MSKDQAKKLIESKVKADRLISGLTPSQKNRLEKSWDVEHAYYSSALEGSKLDKQEFDKLGRDVK